MKAWLRRSRWAFLIIAVMTVLIATTITYPAWSLRVGFRNPEQTIAAGQWGEINGVRWQLSPFTIPPASGGTSIDYDEPPTGSRIATYLLKREHDGQPAGLPPGFRFCLASLSDGTRRWTSTASSYDLFNLTYREGYTTICDEVGPLVVSMYVPEDANITSVEVLLQPGDPPPDSDEADLDDAPVYESFDVPAIVLRFQTG